ncbi:unnamed protein product [Adineta ricciae]|uniref:Uncharacterized protein n=1 Tax=Adineta ricciae TaxID=249248 RepID=A0A815FMM1_ADIRI|nr:unnamed protein product [Adineta ricciae]CAF1327591.1 unnamed protein product [Adineta ricciae]
MSRKNKNKPYLKPTPENSISPATPPLQKTTSTQTDSPEDLRFVCFTSLLLMVFSSIFVYHLWTIPPIDTWAVWWFAFCMENRTVLFSSQWLAW